MRVPPSVCAGAPGGMHPGMKRLTLIAAVAGSAVAAMGAPATAAAPPTTIPLPTGWQPEGIDVHRGDLLVGSIPTGAVLRVDPRDGSQETLVAPRPGVASAIGLKADDRDRLFVAGGRTGKAFVYDAWTGEEIRALALNTTGDAFINDVALFRRFAYFTDSRRSVIYEVRRKRLSVREIPTAIPVPATGNAANGIVATPDGRYLVVVAGGLLYRVDRSTGATQQVDVDPDVTQNGDGLLLQGRRLFIVQNRRTRISEVLLTPSYDAGRALRVIESPDFDVPTTVARKGGAFFLPNARFGVVAPEAAAFSITRVPVR